MPDCRRAFEIDLFAFLEAPRASEFADFRAHYPRCSVCAREMRAWSELHERLAAGAPEATASSARGPSAHPAPERLLRFADAAPDLAPAEARRLEAHLASCPSCRDELTALGHATARHAAAAAPGEGAAARQGLAASVRELLATLGRLAWHPAVAYGALLLLLGPVLYAQWEGGAPLATPSTEVSAPTSASRPGMQAKRRDPGAREAAPSPAEDERPSISRESTPFELAPRALEAPSGEGSHAGAPPSEEPRRTAQDFADARPTAEALRERAPGASRAEPEARSEAEEEAAPAPQPPVRSDVLAEAAPRLEPAPDEPGVLRLHVPIPPGAGATEVRLVSPDGRRALVERFDAPDGTVALRLPRSWLTPGAHRLEIRTPRGRRSLPLEVPASLLRTPDPPAPHPGSAE